MSFSPLTEFAMVSTPTIAAVLVAAAALGAPVLAHAADLTMTDNGRITGPFKFSQTQGSALYKSICQDCHMADGRGAVGAGSYPALAHNPKVGSAGYVIARVLNGQGGMPAFESQLDDQQIAAVVAYVRMAFGNHYQDEVTPVQVKTMRHQLRSEEGRR